MTKARRCGHSVFFAGLSMLLCTASLRGQPAPDPSPAPSASPLVIPAESVVDPLVGSTLPSLKPLPIPSRQDLQVIQEAMETKTYEPFSQTDLGIGIQRLPAIKAVRVTLLCNPQIQFQSATVRSNGGAVQVQEGTFDTIVTGSIAPNLSRNDRTIYNRSIPGASPAPTPYPNPLNARNATVNYELGLQKTLDNGIVINPSVGFTQGVSNDYNQQFNNANSGNVSFGVMIPLARGAGTLVNKAPEIAARFDLLASVLQLRFITSQSVLSTIQAYWACKAAEETYKLQMEAVQSADRLVTISTALVKGDELAPAQLPQILADRASAVAGRVQSESALISARQALAVAMGFNADSLPLAPLAADPFPAPPDEEHYPDARKLIFTALALRDDLRAVKQTVKSRKVLMDAAYLNLRPTINLNLLAGYVPVQTRTNLSITTGNTWQAQAALSLNWPLENDTAIGTWIQSQAALQNSQVTVDNTEITVVSGVITALAQIKAAAENVKLYRNSVRWYKQALEAQELLFQQGQGTLTDTITARQRLINTQINYITAEQTYASSLAQLRFATGMLFFSDEKGSWINDGVWATVPFASLPKP